MNLFHKSYTLLTLILAALCFGCTDEILSPDSPNQPEDSGSGLISIDLPGVMGISLNANSAAETRADDKTSDQKNFNDGIAGEYDLATPDPSSNEYYHYLLLFKTADASSKPLIFPIDDSWQLKYDENSPYNNLTLSISKVFLNNMNGEITDQDDLSNFSTTKELAAYLKGMDAYVLLNFKMSDSGYGEDKNEANYSLSGTTKITGASTLQKLSTLTKSQFESLRMKDFKIRAKKITKDTSGNDIEVEKDFLTMSNSVYSQNGTKVLDAGFDPSKIYTTQLEAALNPSLVVYVERLASKVTVQFDLQKLNTAEFDPYGHQQRIRGVYFDDNNKGLPVFIMEVEKVDMTNGSGITFDKVNGYNINREKVNATLRILGFGLSNLEPDTKLFKDINPSLSSTDVAWEWNDPSNHRSYWARDDKHYLLEKAGSDPWYVGSKAKGYPHQFRLALDADSVSSLHLGLRGTRTGYKDYTEISDEYYVGSGSSPYISYKKLGEIDVTKTIDTEGGEVYLKYKSFDDLLGGFNDINFSRSSTTGRYTYDPMYTLENTYFDPGMLLGAASWIWPWQREPYATATNLIILAEIEFDDNPSDNSSQSGEQGSETPGVGTDGLRTRDSSGIPILDGETRNGPRTVYLGQNNIFYLKPENLLKSKLAILNQVMLEGGNAGIQILHGQWDHHERWTNGNANEAGDSHLDKVAWNENSKLWFGKVQWDKDDQGNETNHVTLVDLLDDDGKPVVDSEGNNVQRVPLSEEILLQVDDNIVNYLTLIPAEISGGDGQRLIAPHENYMGKDYRYYLAPEKEETYSEEENGQTVVKKRVVMDKKLAVEISYNHLVALIHKIIGPVDVYTNGKMYFSVPIPHYYSSYGPNSNKNAWKRLGGFSIVRNNWYNITVEQITRMGTPVDVSNQPIVPVMDVKRSYINLGVTVKEWHDLTQDNIPLM